MIKNNMLEVKEIYVSPTIIELELPTSGREIYKELLEKGVPFVVSSKFDIEQLEERIY